MKNTLIQDGIIHYYGNPAGYIEGDKAIIDPIFRREELVEFLTDQFLAVEVRAGVFDCLIVAREKPSQSAGGLRPMKRCRIWQLGPESDVMVRFIAYDELIAGGHGEPNAEQYRLVYDGEVASNDLDQIYATFNLQHPHGFTGHSLSMSDVIELYDGAGSDHFYVDRFGFQKIAFFSADHSQTQTQDMSR